MKKGLSGHNFGEKMKKGGGINNIIVVYSGFRSSSTWFWSRVRKIDSLRCYYEVFHEALGFVAAADIARSKPSTWRSRHPDDEAGYQIEYVPLFDGGTGIPGFPVEESLGSRFVGRQGIDGPLDEDVREYLEKLIEFARMQGQIPVLSCTRMLARSSGIRKSFSGLHILLVRNLFRQWNSYAGQHRTGNIYFLSTLFATLSHAGSIPYIAYLACFFSEESRSSLEQWLEKDNYDKVFCYFVASHIYFLLHTRRNVDVVVDIDALSDPSTGHRQEVEAAVQSAIGVEIDLSGAREAIDYPMYPLRSAEECRRILQGMVEKAYVFLDADEDEKEFSRKLLKELWEEYERFSFYTKSAAEAIESDSLRQALEAEKEGAWELREALDRQRHDFEILEKQAADARKDALNAQQIAHEVSEELTGVRSALGQEQEEKAGLTAQVASLRADLEEVGRALELERVKRHALAVEHSQLSEMMEDQLLQERAEKAALAAEFGSLKGEFEKACHALELERGRHHAIAVERARLFQKLELESGPLALRRVLPLARLLRPLIRFNGKIKRAVRASFGS